MTDHDICTRRIFAQLQASDRLSQRALSRDLGIALGRTNGLLRQMIESGWVEVVRDADRRLRYTVTPAGAAAEAALSRRYFEYAIALYSETRGRVRASLDALSRGWPPAWSAVPGEKRLAFFGDGELAEIAYVALKDTDLRLVAVVADAGPRPFLGAPGGASPVAVISPSAVDDVLCDCMLILSFDASRRTPPPLAAAGFPEGRIAWL